MKYGFEEPTAFGLRRGELRLQPVADRHQFIDLGDDAVLFCEWRDCVKELVLSGDGHEISGGLTFDLVYLFCEQVARHKPHQVSIDQDLRIWTVVSRLWAKHTITLGNCKPYRRHPCV